MNFPKSFSKEKAQHDVGLLGRKVKIPKKELLDFQGALPF